MIKAECSGDYKRLAIAWVTLPDALEAPNKKFEPPYAKNRSSGPNHPPTALRSPSPAPPVRAQPCHSRVCDPTHAWRREEGAGDDIELRLTPSCRTRSPLG